MKNAGEGKLPTVFVIFGATGDLSRRKLLPALYRLFEKGHLAGAFQIVGFARRPLSREEFHEFAKTAVPDAKKAVMEDFLRHVTYLSGNFDLPSGYKILADFLGFKDRQWRVCSNKLFYLAVPPANYATIFRQLADSGLTDPCDPEEGWTRILVEKPFGRDLLTAQELDAMLGKLFREEQIYRIDHYLGKETVQNILAFRFSNSFLEPAWNRKHIEEISVRLWEPQGVEDRGAFYDGIGALRDVGQNHLLQLLALFTMDNPRSFAAEAIRKERLQALRSLAAPADLLAAAHRGQYAGYRSEKGVAGDSATETFFRIRTEVANERWRGVPIYLEAGKKLGPAKVEVVVRFRHETPCLCPPGPHRRNVLRYEIQPNEKITASFWVKRPGSEMVLEEKDFSFDYAKAFSKKLFVEAYEKLLLDALNGNQTLFVSTDEILASWGFIDPILSAWTAEAAPLHIYESHADLLPRLEERGMDAFEKEIGYVGLGKMGKNMVLRLAQRGWKIVATDAHPEAARSIAGDSVSAAADAKETVEKLARSPRIVWLMVPAGKPVDDVLFGKNGIAKSLAKGDIVIDGGNSFFEDTVRRGKLLAKRGIRFLDAGTSGGPGGARSGACLMIGGDASAYLDLMPLWKDLARDGEAFDHVGDSGAGHFVKMVHNGIEYGMMQAIAEGFELLRRSKFSPNLERVARLYNKGSVIESRLIGWLERAFAEHGEDLDGISGTVGHTGEGEWTAKTAKKLRVPAPIIEESFKFRVRSAKRPSYAGQVLSALRNQFGGHAAKKEAPKAKKKIA